MRSIAAVTFIVLTTTFNFASANDFAEVSTRPLPIEDLQLLNETRSQAAEDEQELHVVEEGDETIISLKTASSANNFLNKNGNILVMDAFPDYQVAHIATYFSPDGRIVELEDESQWLITINDLIISSRWLSNDPLVITPNKDFFFKTTNYKLTNLNTNDTVRVDLIRGPRLNGYYTRFVAAVDLMMDAIYLNDGTRWDVSWTDSSMTHHWMPNDVVIIGSNSGWFSSRNPSILINVSLNQYVSARRVY